MRSYPIDSPSALARLAILAMLADGDLDHRELAMIDRLRLPEMLGLTRDEFVQVMIDFCRDLAAETQAKHVRLLAPERIETLLAEVRAPRLRRAACAAMLVLAKSDGEVSAAEQNVLAAALDRWQLKLDDLAAEAVP
jgi:tellurite resistance protein